MDRRSMKCNISEDTKQKNCLQAQQNNNKTKELELKQERQKMKEQLKEEQDRMNRRFLLQTKHILGNDSNHSFSHYYLSERASKNPHSMMLFNRLNKTAMKNESGQTQRGQEVMENIQNPKDNTQEVQQNNGQNIETNNNVAEETTQELIKLQKPQDKDINTQFPDSKGNPWLFNQRDSLLRDFLKNQRMFSPQQSRRDNVFGLEDYFKQNTTYKSLHRMIRRSSCECLQCGGRCLKTQQLKGTIPSFVPRQITRLSLMKKWRKATKTLRQLCHFFKSTVKSQKPQNQRKIQNYRYTIVVNKQINMKQLAQVSPVALKSPLRGSHQHKTNPINNTNSNNSLGSSNYRASSPNSRRDSNIFSEFRRQSSLQAANFENEKDKAVGSPKEHGDSNKKVNYQSRLDSFSQRNISRKQSSNPESFDDEVSQYSNKHSNGNPNNSGILRVKTTQESISLEQEMKQALTNVDGAFIQELAQEQQFEMKAEEKKHSLFRPPHNASSFSYARHSVLKDDNISGGTFRNLSTTKKNLNHTSQPQVSSQFLQPHWITQPSSFQVKSSTSTQQKEKQNIKINNNSTSQNHLHAVIPQIFLQTPQKISNNNNSAYKTFQHTLETNSQQIPKQSQKYQSELGSSQLQSNKSRDYQQYHQQFPQKHPSNLQPTNPSSSRYRYPPRLNLQESNFFTNKSTINNNTNSNIFLTNQSFQQSPQVIPTHRKGSCAFSSRSIIQPRPSISKLFPLSNSPSMGKLLSSPVLSSSKPMISNNLIQGQVVDQSTNEIKESIQQSNKLHQKQQPKSQSHSDLATAATGVLDFLIPQKKLHNHGHQNRKHKQHSHSLESKREKSQTELDSFQRFQNLIGNKTQDNRGVLEHKKSKANKSHPYLLFHQERLPQSRIIDFRTNHSKDVRAKSLGKKINYKQMQQIKKSEVSMGTLRLIYNCHSQREEAHGGSMQQQLQLNSSCMFKQPKVNRETTTIASTRLIKQISSIRFQEDEFQFDSQKSVVKPEKQDNLAGSVVVGSVI